MAIEQQSVVWTVSDRRVVLAINMITDNSVDTRVYEIITGKVGFDSTVIESRQNL